MRNKNQKIDDRINKPPNKQKEQTGKTKLAAHYPIALEDCPDLTGHPKSAIGKVAQPTTEKTESRGKVGATSRSADVRGP